MAEIKQSMGPGTLEISPELYALNRRRLVERLSSFPTTLNSIVVLQGGKEVPLYDTDITYTFRQEPYFRWAFGVAECDCYGAIAVNTGETYLFVPRYPNSCIYWMGPLRSPEEFKIKYQVDNACYIEEMQNVLKSLDPSALLTLNGENSDSGLKSDPLKFDGIDEFVIDDTILFSEIADLRVIKTEYELEVMRYVCEVSCAAHLKLMKMARPGLAEYQFEAKFLYEIYSSGGCQHTAYDSICCSGPNAAILHYGFDGATKSRILKDGDMCLFDMGGSYFGYAADITCSFPVNGKFTPDQKLIYETVLKANLGVAKEAKPGTSWPCMHLLGIRILLAGLKDGGLLQGDIPDMIEAGVGKIFQPHGLGHLIGLDVHDVGGYLPGNPERLSHPDGIAALRTARFLKPGMMITIEPGCYFIDHLLDQAMDNPDLSQFLIPDAINRFRGFGGVRIEDVVVITESGAKILTTVPRSTEDIEKWMSNKNEEPVH